MASMRAMVVKEAGGEIAGEIAAAASFFASPAAASVTGQELVIDGGQTLDALSVARSVVTAGGH